MAIPAADLPPLTSRLPWGGEMYELGFSSTSISPWRRHPVVNGQRTEYSPFSGSDTAACWAVFFVFFSLRCRLASKRPTGLTCLLSRLRRQHAGLARLGWQGLELSAGAVGAGLLVAESERRPHVVLILRQTLAPCPPVGAILPGTLQGTPSHRPSPYPRRRPPYDQPRLCPLSKSPNFDPNRLFVPISLLRHAPRHACPCPACIIPARALRVLHSVG